MENIKMISTEEDRKLACIDIEQHKQLQEKKVTFIAYINETDNGCDYTIACGKTLWELEAETKEDALLELKRKITPPFEDDEGIYELEFVVLYQISNEISVPIEKWYSERVEQERNMMVVQKVEKERAEYKRLQKKYG